MSNTSDIERMEHAVKTLWIVFAPIIFLVGCLGNALNILVLIKMKFHRNPTLFLLFLLAVTDAAVLVVGPPRYFFLNAIDFDLRTVSGFSCKLSLFLIYFTMHMSSWILVLVTAVRFAKSVFPIRFGAIITLRKVLIAYIITLIFFTILDLHFFWTNGIDKDNDCGSLTPESLHFDEFQFIYIDFAFLLAIPGTIIVILNILILRKIQFLKKTAQRRGSEAIGSREPISKVTRMLIVTSIYFVIANLPISLYFIVDSYVRPDAAENNDARTEAELDLAHAIFYLLQFSQYSLNFYFYTATNDKYRRVLQRTLSSGKRRFLNFPRGDIEMSSVQDSKVRNYSRSATISS